MGHRAPDTVCNRGHIQYTQTDRKREREREIPASRGVATGSCRQTRARRWTARSRALAEPGRRIENRKARSGTDRPLMHVAATQDRLSGHTSVRARIFASKPPSPPCSLYPASTRAARRQGTQGRPWPEQTSSRKRLRAALTLNPQPYTPRARPSRRHIPTAVGRRTAT